MAELAANHVDASSVNLTCFEVKGQLYAIEVENVREIARIMQITPLPNAPRLIEGVIDLRGAVIPVVDLACVLNRGKGTEDIHARIIVVEIDGLVFGLWVDAATDVLTGLQTGLINALPATPLTALSLQWFRSAPNMFDHRFAPLMGATIISQRTWAKIEAGDREVIRASASGIADYLFEEVPAQEEQALAEMQRRGLTITEVDPRDEDEWRGLALHLQNRMREVTVPKEIFDQASEILAEYRQAKGEESD